ncbi:hypothetical protein CPC08DRAFT_226492 [Agrocybe pediades]|nr:hypothetical protein CPC08DRAFT_226492 [Agrocybe pediades]
MLADLHSIVTPPGGVLKFLHKSFADFLSEPQRAGDLYQDLSRARLSHVSGVISFFSTRRGQQTGHVSCSGYIDRPMKIVLSELNKPDNMKADFISSGILQASQKFPIFEFTRPLLLDGRTERQNPIPSFKLYEDWDFIQCYMHYLYCVKDVCESIRFMYWEKMRQYCECVLSVLDDNLSGNWDAQFVFAYNHLLHDPRYCLPRKLSYVNLYGDLSAMPQDAQSPSLCDTILFVIGLVHRDSPYPYSNDIAKTFHDLMGDIKKEVIFAMSASFCLALLCDESRASQDAGRIYGIARHDRRKKRDHPWHWRQMVPRPPSLGNRLVLMCFRNHGYLPYTTRLTRIQKALRTSMPSGYRYGSILLFTMREYFEIKSQPPQPWPWRMSIKYTWQEWPTFIFLLDLLPHILPLAGRYEPLVDMCRKKCLSSLSQVWPKKSRRARQAIDSYLRRMDSQEGGE